MKRLLIIPFLFCLQVNSQVKSPISFDYYRTNEFYDKTNLKKATINEYNPQIGFEKLDSLSKSEFLTKITTLNFNNQKVIKYLQVGNPNEEFLKEREEYSISYDVNNNLKEVIFTSRYKNKYIYEYNLDSTEVKIFYYEDLQDISEKRIKYDRLRVLTLKNGKTVKELDDSNGIISEHVYKYNSEGDIVYDKSYGVVEAKKYKYNIKKQIVAETTKNSRGLRFLTMYTYAKNGRLLQEKYFRNNFNSPVEIKNYKYENGFLKSLEIVSHPYKNVKNKEVRLYINDEQGNWVNLKVYKRGVLQYVANRYLTY